MYNFIHLALKLYFDYLVKCAYSTVYNNERNFKAAAEISKPWSHLFYSWMKRSSHFFVKNTQNDRMSLLSQPGTVASVPAFCAHALSFSYPVITPVAFCTWLTQQGFIKLVVQNRRWLLSRRTADKRIITVSHPKHCWWSLQLSAGQWTGSSSYTSNSGTASLWDSRIHCSRHVSAQQPGP